MADAARPDAPLYQCGIHGRLLCSGGLCSTPGYAIDCVTGIVFCHDEGATFEAINDVEELDLDGLGATHQRKPITFCKAGSKCKEPIGTGCIRADGGM
jgi:hypothetical protein